MIVVHSPLLPTPDARRPAPNTALRSLRLPLAPSLVDLHEGLAQTLGDVPARVVGFQLVQVRDVADVVTLTVLVHVLVLHLLAGDLRDQPECLQDRHRVRTPATQVVHLSLTRRVDEPLHEGHHVVAVDVVPHLLALVPEHPIGAAFQVALDQVAQEAVQLDAAVVRTGQAPAPQTARAHPEVAAVLLHHDVRRHLGCPEQRMLALVDPEGLPDTVVVGRIRVVPARLQFLQGDLVRSIAIDLVRAHVHERGLRTRQARSLQQVQRTHSVDVEVVERPARRQVVARLRRRVHHRIGLHRLQQFHYRRAVADVHLMMLERRMGFLQPFEIPSSVPLRTEEVRAHVVVHAMDRPAVGREARHHLRADQAGGTRDQECSQPLFNTIDFQKLEDRKGLLVLCRRKAGKGRTEDEEGEMDRVDLKWRIELRVHQQAAQGRNPKQMERPPSGDACGEQAGDRHQHQCCQDQRHAHPAKGDAGLQVVVMGIGLPGLTGAGSV